MVENLADFLLAAKAVRKRRGRFPFRDEDLDRDLAPGFEIGPSKNRRHAASGNEGVDAVMIELVAWMDGSSRERVSGRNPAAIPELGEPVRSPAVHAHAFHTANADQLQADIITTVSLVGNIHQSLCRLRQIATVARERGHF